MSANIATSLRRPIAARIVERVSAGVQKPIYVTDPSAEVVASSDATVLGRRNEVAARAILNEALARSESAAGTTLGLPLIYGGCVVGAIVLDTVAAQGEELGYMARALAELIIHQMTVIEQLPRRSWAREKFLFDLLHGHLASTPDTAIQEAALLDIDLTIPRVVVLVAIELSQPDGARAASPQPALPRIERDLWLKQRQSEQLALALDIIGCHKADIASFITDRWMAILPALDSSAIERDRRRIAEATQRFIDALATRSGATATAGIGRYYAGWPALAQCFADARFALETGLQIHGPAKVFMPGNLGVASFVCSNDPVLKAQLAHHLLHRVEEEPELLSTIEVFLDSDLSPSLAAERLHIHRHTLAHRLNKVARLTSLDPRRFQDLAQLYAALVLRRMCADPIADSQG
jgi:carbohydrate diacid regulator